MNAARTLRSLATRTARRAAVGTVAAALLTSTLGLAAAAPASAAPANNPSACNYLGYRSAPDLLGLKHDTHEQQMFDAINAYRTANGLQPLKRSTSLARPAMWMALDSLTRTTPVVNHVDSRGMDPATRVAYCTDNAGYSAYQGEIIYWATGGSKSTAVNQTLTWWKNSPGHNARLLDPNARYMSVAWAYNGVNAEQKYYWAVDFGR